MAKSIELKALKTIKKTKGKQNSSKNLQKFSSTDSCSKSKVVSKCENSVTNLLIDDDSKDKTEEEEFVDEEEDSSRTGIELKNQSKSDTISEPPKKGSKRANSDKTESPPTELQEHQCPDCLRVFTYMANFRKHITSVCPVRKQLSSDGTNNSSDSIPLAKSKESTEVIVIKEEKPDLEETDCSDVIDGVKQEVDDEIVFDGETRIEFTEEDNEEGVDCVSPKDESKLDLWRVKQENPQFAFKGSPGVPTFILFCS